MKFVPSIPMEGQASLPDGVNLTYDDTKSFKILFGGDQLTVARIRGTQALPT